jgi:hypothetical protein
MMRISVGIAIAVVVVLAGTAFFAYAQFRPEIDSTQASSIAMSSMAGSMGITWAPKSATLDVAGSRPPVQNPDGNQVPKCWGSMISVGGGYCLPYPVWQVHLVGIGADGQCEGTIVFVDGRNGKVHQFHSTDCGA